MIFSRWRPDTGGYDYFDSPSTRYGLGDDLPVPRLPQVTVLGACSTDVGRALPIDARKVGTGPIARGMVAPMGRIGGISIGSIDFTAPVSKFVIGASAAVAAAWLLLRKKK